MHSIAAFGAVGDGATLNTGAFARTIAAVVAAGGGTVFVPAGIWRTGTITLASRVTLELHPAATILGSEDLADYLEGKRGQHGDRSPWHLVVADGAEDIVIRGGTIDGNGPAFWEPCRPGPDSEIERVKPGAYRGLDPMCVVPERDGDDATAPLRWIAHVDNQRPSPMIEITDCRNVRIENVHITNSAGWLLHTHNSRWLWIAGVKLTSNLMGPNNDGFDINGCQDVVVSDCNLSCCDDGICLKTTPDARPVERVTITGCTVRSRCAAIKFGCAESYRDFRQVTIANCVVYESNRGIALYSKCGAVIEDVTITNLVIDTRSPMMASRPIHIECCEDDNGQGKVRGIGAIRNVHISNVIARSEGRVLLVGDPRSPLRGIVLRDVRLVYPTIDDPALCFADLPHGQFAKYRPEVRPVRAAVVAAHVHDLSIESLTVDWPVVETDGRTACPDSWRFAHKAVNGGTQLYPRDAFNRDHLPPFSVVWARDVRGRLTSRNTQATDGAAFCDADATCVFEIC